MNAETIPIRTAPPKRRPLRSILMASALYGGFVLLLLAAFAR